jgi:hypothetical protein
MCVSRLLVFIFMVIRDPDGRWRHPPMPIVAVKKIIGQTYGLSKQCSIGGWRPRRLPLLGSDRVERLYGAENKVHTPYYDWGTGRRLTDEERAQLTQNTAEFIEQLEAERLRHEENAVKVEQMAPARAVAVMPAPVQVFSALFERRVAIGRHARATTSANTTRCPLLAA